MSLVGRFEDKIVRLIKESICQVKYLNKVMLILLGILEKNATIPKAYYVLVKLKYINYGNYQLQPQSAVNNQTRSN